MTITTFQLEISWLDPACYASMWSRTRYCPPRTASSVIRLYSWPLLTTLLPRLCTPSLLLAATTMQSAHNVAPRKEGKNRATAKGHKE